MAIQWPQCILCTVYYNSITFMPIVPEFAALGAALCWSLSSLLSMTPTQKLGSITFVRIRMTAVVIILLVYLRLFGNLEQAFSSMLLADILILMLSGVIGIFIGDVLLFLTMDRLGPRRTSTLFATNAPMQVLLGFLFLGEVLSTKQYIGSFLIILGTYLAIVYGKRRSQVHSWENVSGLLVIGVLLGLGAALGQAAGALLTKPIMAQGASPIAATIIRVSAAVFLLWLGFFSKVPSFSAKASLTPRLLMQSIISGFIGMALGMSLLLYALKYGDLGTTAILSSISPVLLLPMLWIKTREAPAIGAWLGAIMVVIGLIFIT